MNETKLPSWAKVEHANKRWTLKSLNQYVADQGDLNITVIRNPDGTGGYWVRYHQYQYDFVMHTYTLLQAYYVIAGMIQMYNIP